MAFFTTTKGIFDVEVDQEYFDQNWLNYSKHDKKSAPLQKNWTYEREMFIEDVDVWEQFAISSGGIGVYASWSPFAEFYLYVNKGENVFITLYDKEKKLNANNALENYLINKKIHQWGMLPYKLNKNINLKNVIINGINYDKRAFFENYERIAKNEL